MPLIERLTGLGIDEPGGERKLAIHAYMSALAEVERGKMTGAQVAAAFDLTAAEQAETQTLYGRVITQPESYSLGGFAVLTNVGTAYDGTPASRGLGFLRLQTGGITGVEFAVRVNKVGTGTQDWQLWNDTGATEVAAVSDAGAAGVKTLSVTRQLPGPLSKGTVDLRVRARSSAGADDPEYYGATIRVARVERLTAEELHEILLLGEHAVPPYDTAAAVRARLGL